jgi:hypothetical protein
MAIGPQKGFEASLADAELIQPQFRNILDFFECHIDTRTVKLNNIAFEASNL